MDTFTASGRLARRRRSATCAGLDIGAGRLRLAVVRRRRGGLQLERLAGERADTGNFESLLQACRRLLQRYAPDAGAVVVAVPAAAAVATRMILPAASRDAQRLAQVRAGLAAYGLAPESLALDYRVLGPAPASPADVEVLALSVPSLIAEDRLALAESLALPLRALPADGWCLAAFLRNAPDQAVLHLDGAGCWLSRHPRECRALQWQAAMPAPGLLLELAPLLQASPLLLTGDHPQLVQLALALRKYAGLSASIAALPGRLRMNDMFAAAVTAAELAAFHCALALAAQGLA